MTICMYFLAVCSQRFKAWWLQTSAAEKKSDGEAGEVWHMHHKLMDCGWFFFFLNKSKKKWGAVFCACNQNKPVFPRYETYLPYNEDEIILITFARHWSFFLACNSAPQRTGSAKQMFKSGHLWSVNAVASGEISVILPELVKRIRSKHWYSTNTNCVSTLLTLLAVALKLFQV